MAESKGLIIVSSWGLFSFFHDRDLTETHLFFRFNFVSDFVSTMKHMNITRKRLIEGAIRESNSFNTKNYPLFVFKHQLINSVPHLFSLA